MGTDARFSCPVCCEPYAEAPAECFRCETPLGAWWRFESAVARERPRGPLRIAPIVGAAVLGALVTAVVLRATTRTAPVATAVSAVSVPTVPVAAAPAATPSPAAAPASAIRYRVQPGDSLWRVAAALTGDGRNWRTLWPAMDPDRPLAVGTLLEVPAVR